MRVAVIGGGLAGLAAAYHLVRHGCAVTLWEKEPVLGGQVRTFAVGGERVEGFYHHMFASDADLIRLIDELGLGADLEWHRSRVGYFSGGRAYPFVTPLDLLRFRPLGLVDRVRVGLVSLRLQRRQEWHDLEGVSAREWLPGRTGRRGYEVIFEPLLRGKFGDYAGDISMAWLWNKFRLRLSSRGRGMQHEKLGYLKGSFYRVVEGLAGAIRDGGGTIVVGQPVVGLQVDSNRVTGVVVGGNPVPCDVVVAAIPSPAFLALAPPLPDGYREKVESIPYLAALCLVLVLSHPFTPFYWLNMGSRSIPFVAAVEHTNLVPAERYGGRRILYISNYLSPQDELYGLGARELVERYWSHLREIYPPLDPAWVEEYHVFRERAAQPVVTTGYGVRVPPLRTPVKGLYLASTSQIYPEDRGMNYSLRLGLGVGQMVLEDQKGDTVG